VRKTFVHRLPKPTHLSRGSDALQVAAVRQLAARLLLTRIGDGHIPSLAPPIAIMEIPGTTRYAPIIKPVQQTAVSMALTIPPLTV
jgi:hypothetical protein